MVTCGVPALDVVREYRRGEKRFWLSEAKAPIRSPEGSIIGLLGVTRDVTERIETAEAFARARSNSNRRRKWRQWAS